MGCEHYYRLGIGIYPAFSSLVVFSKNCVRFMKKFQIFLFVFQEFYIILIGKNNRISKKECGKMFYNDSEFGLIELLQSRRRKISLSIKIDTCSIVIKTPHQLNDTQIAEIIDNHRLWLRKKLSNIKKFDKLIK